MLAMYVHNNTLHKVVVYFHFYVKPGTSYHYIICTSQSILKYEKKIWPGYGGINFNTEIGMKE